MDIDKAGGVGERGHVAADAEGVAVQRQRSFLRSCFVDIADDHVGSVLGELPCGGKTDSLGSTGDDGGAT